VRVGSKPMMIFNGDEFETNDDLALLKNLLLDYFRGDVLPKINLAGLDTIIVTTAAEGKVYFRVFGVALKKSGMVRNIQSMFTPLSLSLSLFLCICTFLFFSESKLEFVCLLVCLVVLFFLSVSPLFSIIKPTHNILLIIIFIAR
jgi:hypothetical protein